MKVNHEILAQEFERVKGDRNRLRLWWIKASAFINVQDSLIHQCRDLIRKLVDLIPANVENATHETWLEWFKAMRRDQERYHFLREHWTALTERKAATLPEKEEDVVYFVAEIDVDREKLLRFDVESLDRAIDKHLRIATDDKATVAAGLESVGEGTRNCASEAQSDQPPSVSANGGAAAEQVREIAAQMSERDDYP